MSNKSSNIEATKESNKKESSTENTTQNQLKTEAKNQPIETKKDNTKLEQVVTEKSLPPSWEIKKRETLTGIGLPQGQFTLYFNKEFQFPLSIIKFIFFFFEKHIEANCSFYQNPRTNLYSNNYFYYRNRQQQRTSSLFRASCFFSIYGN